MSESLLDVRCLHARYGERTVLADVNVRIETGEWFCLLGPNGVGKSTLLHCVSGRLAPVAGDVLVDGYSVVAQPVQAKHKLGYACAPEQLPELLTGRQCLEVYANAKDLLEIDRGVLTLADQLRFTPYLDQFVDSYSLGTRQKLCILLAMLGDPTLLVLDEAFTGLDPNSALILKRLLQQRLAERRCALLLATHSLDIVEHYADRAALLNDGRIEREWSRQDIAELRLRGANAFEEALAAGVNGA